MSHFQITRPLVRLLVCCGLYILVQTLMPKVLAMKRTSDIEEYMIGEQRTRKRQNYVEKMGIENEFFENVDEVGPSYDTKLVESSKEQLPAFILDYANMIRNDIILLDNSVETRTRKRGNIKVEKHNHAVPDPPCNCEHNKDIIDLGEDYYPRFVENRTCSKQMCSDFYMCQSNLYELTVLKKRISMQESQVDLPSDLRHRWVAEKQIVTIGCVCTKNYGINGEH
ncbi:prothoracicotropic hormone isoform X1 [Ostrinia nubilalis]|uniref:prothoracicotropic hormone isoform X1 n=1 Tax=Ostrinia nubilalis TaxID=29057 RepID=UPI0030822508